MEIYEQRSMRDPDTNKLNSKWYKLNNETSRIVIDNGEYAIEVGYDEEYTGGFVIIPITKEEIENIKENEIETS